MYLSIEKFQIAYMLDEIRWVYILTKMSSLGDTEDLVVVEFQKPSKEERIGLIAYMNLLAHGCGAWFFVPAQALCETPTIYV